MREIHIEDDGQVWGWCSWDERETYIDREPVPASFEPEPEENEDLPF
jgi:hypothetical protein